MIRASGLATVVLLLSASAADAKAVKVERNSKALEFTFEWSSEAAAIPALNKEFRTKMEKAFKRATANAAEDAKSAKDMKRDFHAHFYNEAWTAAGQSARLLSLQGQIGTFTGGAHPNSTDAALLWDRALNRKIEMTGLFTSTAGFETVTRQAYCRALDAERKRRRQGEDLGAVFGECPKYSDLAIAPKDKNRDGRFDTIEFIASPYVAGPYVEGDYEIDLPVTRRLMMALKPAYRASFKAQPQ
jgi:Deacetylase PdaC